VVERTVCHGDDDITVGEKLGIRKYSVARRRHRGLLAFQLGAFELSGSRYVPNSNEGSDRDGGA